MPPCFSGSTNAVYIINNRRERRPLTSTTIMATSIARVDKLWRLSPKFCCVTQKPILHVSYNSYIKMQGLSLKVHCQNYQLPMKSSTNAVGDVLMLVEE